MHTGHAVLFVVAQLRFILQQNALYLCKQFIISCVCILNFNVNM